MGKCLAEKVALVERYPLRFPFRLYPNRFRRPNAEHIVQIERQPEHVEPRPQVRARSRHAHLDFGYSRSVQILDFGACDLYLLIARSEERRVGKECRVGGSPAD